ncbi:CatB-related O-acetyltransferase [Xanthobacter sp. 126]|jgi:acetyltransferase-like isoleucine patch superfamily enzyme|uniref:CatB-related O-acetyltransferase n=1 Tax=Xanthobacter sp. 126 TaxID=1131814 RepID=UPI00045E60FE|nr:CatB-related O-acetyltransferase [Xanthobacter sp. 126]
MKKDGIEANVDLSAAHSALAFEPPTLVTKDVRSEFPSRFGAFSMIHAPGHVCWLEIGRYCSIAPGVTLGANEHDMTRLSTSSSFENPALYGWDRFVSGQDAPERHWFQGSVKPVKIGHDVWIGQNAFIRSGVTIGNGAVIAALSCITRDVPAYAIMAGNPAQIVRYRFDPETIVRLERLRWWRFSIADLVRFDITNMPACLDGLEKAIEDGSIQPYEPAWLSAADLL